MKIKTPEAAVERATRFKSSSNIESAELIHQRHVGNELVYVAEVETDETKDWIAVSEKSPPNEHDPDEHSNVESAIREYCFFEKRLLSQSCARKNEIREPAEVISEPINLESSVISSDSEFVCQSCDERYNLSEQPVSGIAIISTIGNCQHSVDLFHCNECEEPEMKYGTKGFDELIVRGEVRSIDGTVKFVGGTVLNESAIGSGMKYRMGVTPDF